MKNKRVLKIKETKFLVNEYSGDVWHEEINNWLFNSYFHCSTDKRHFLEDGYTDID
jgi:hypothetical protein